MFKFTSEDSKRLEADLRTFARKALPFASRFALNDTAEAAQGFWQAEIRDGFTLRNTFTERSIWFVKTRSLKISSQETVVGSVAPFMKTQEEGGTKVKTGTEGVPLATSFASGEGKNKRPRTRLAKRANKMASIKLPKRSRGALSRKARNAAAIRQATSGGSKFVFLNLGRRKGIFKVIGGKRHPEIRMVWDLSHESVDIPKHPTLAPAVQSTEKIMPQLYHDQLIRQAKRQGLFTG